MRRVFFAFAVMAAMISCQNISTDEKQKAENAQETTAIQTKIVSANQQQALSPDLVIHDLKEGNSRFINNELSTRDNQALVKDAVSGQYPKAIILSCIDSRVPVEEIFDQGIGDLFVGRLAGNIVNEDMLGSMEYSCKVAGSKLILVMGHESCGAVKAAIDEVELGNITGLLSKIEPAIKMSEDFEGEHSTKNAKYVDHVITNNVLLTIEQIREDSPILKEMEDKGEIKIVGAYYSLHSGEVSFL